VWVEGRGAPCADSPEKSGKSAEDPRTWRSWAWVTWRLSTKPCEDGCKGSVRTADGTGRRLSGRPGVGNWKKSSKEQVRQTESGGDTGLEVREWAWWPADHVCHGSWDLFIFSDSTPKVVVLGEEAKCGEMHSRLMGLETMEKSHPVS